MDVIIIDTAATPELYLCTLAFLTLSASHDIIIANVEGKGVTKKMRLLDLIKKNLNERAREELNEIKILPVAFATRALDRWIETAKINGRAVRVEKKKTMSKVIRVLYTYLYESATGQVSPSMRTIAFAINQELEEPNNLLDSTAVIKTKEKAIHKTVMSVQRAVVTMQELGLITVHQYYTSDSHEESNKLACFFYEIAPISKFCPQYADSTLDKNYRPTSAVIIYERKLSKCKRKKLKNYNRATRKITKEMIEEKKRIKELQEERKAHRIEMEIERRKSKIKKEIADKQAAVWAEQARRRDLIVKADRFRELIRIEKDYQKRLSIDPNAERYWYDPKSDPVNRSKEAHEKRLMALNELAEKIRKKDREQENKLNSQTA